MVDLFVRFNDSEAIDPSGSFDEVEDEDALEWDGSVGGSLMMTSDGIDKFDPMEPLVVAFAIANLSSSR